MAGERIYLAGPGVFLPDAVAYGARKKAVCAEHGFVGVFPLDGSVDLAGLAPFDQALRIAEANERHMRDCDLAVADMTPFRGISMDVGTAYEMGFVRALGKPVLGYSNVATGFVERIRAAFPGEAADPFGMTFEDFGMADNLMMHAAVHLSGAPVLAADVPEAERFTSLAVFARVLAAWRRRG